MLGFFIENVRDAVQNKNTKPDNITILGNWGIGKTSTLLKFQDIIHKEMKDSINVFSVLFSLKPSVCESADVFTSCLLDVIEETEHLDLDDREYLLDILSKRLVELRRTEISKRVKEAVTAYKEGNVKSGNFDDLWKDLNQ